MSAHEVAAETDEQSQAPSTLVHIVAPLLAIAGTWAIRRAMSAGYRAVSGSKAPDAQDPSVSWTKALMWTAVTASTAACFEVAVYRYLNSRSHTR